MNYFMRKIQLALARVKKQGDRILDVEPILRAFEEAFTAQMGEECRMIYHNGYAVFERPTRFRFKYRVRELERMTQILWARMHERDLLIGMPESDK